MRLIDGDALEELFRETIGHIAKMPEIDGALEHLVRASAMAVEMIQDAPTITPEPGWISVKDRLPESNEAVLVAVLDKEGYFYRAIAVRYPCGDWDSNDDYFSQDEADVRYWMHLPEPPKEETE